MSYGFRYIAAVDLVIGKDSSDDDVVQQFAVSLYCKEQARFIQCVMSDEFDYEPKEFIHSKYIKFSSHSMATAAYNILMWADCVIVDDLDVVSRWLMVGDPFYPGKVTIPWYEAKNIIAPSRRESMDCGDGLDRCQWLTNFGINQSMAETFAGQRVAYARKNSDWEFDTLG